MKLKTLAVAVVAATGALAAGLVQAHTDVQWSVTLGNAFPIYAPAPVYAPAPAYAPPPVYVRPYPVYQPYRVVVPPPVVVRAPVYGVRYDSRYRSGWHRAGDGIPNKHDRHPGHPGGQHGGR